MMEFSPPLHSFTVKLTVKITFHDWRCNLRHQLLGAEHWELLPYIMWKVAKRLVGRRASRRNARAGSRDGSMDRSRYGSRDSSTDIGKLRVRNEDSEGIFIFITPYNHNWQAMWKDRSILSTDFRFWFLIFNLNSWKLDISRGMYLLCLHDSFSLPFDSLLVRSQISDAPSTVAWKNSLNTLISPDPKDKLLRGTGISLTRPIRTRPSMILVSVLSEPIEPTT